MSKSLKAQQSPLADAEAQLDILEHGHSGVLAHTPFQAQLEHSGLYPLRPKRVEIFQINIGKMCNQTCKHCHVDAGPDRKEIMTRATMVQCLDALRSNPDLKTVDLTGGAPEMHPDFRWFAKEIAKLGRHVIVRSNLTIILANKQYHDLPDFFKLHHIEVISSLPYYAQSRTDRQRGDGVFEQSITALQMLNAVGYGKADTGLLLNLVYNPAGAFLPPSQAALEVEYKKVLHDKYNIEFNHLFTITNLPISRYLDYLITSGNYEDYMAELVNAYNPAAAANVMCRNTISIGWDGALYDCDFNQMLELKVDSGSNHVSKFNIDELNKRNIVVGQHCYGCTAGAGSGCGGEVV
jgi:radical SAM/Cys-rich protein